MSTRSDEMLAFVCSWSPSAEAKPKSSVAPSSPNGFHFPNTSAAKAMKPLPFVIWFVNASRKPNDR
jgi:hypothetical protein